MCSWRSFFAIPLDFPPGRNWVPLHSTPTPLSHSARNKDIFSKIHNYNVGPSNRRHLNNSKRPLSGRHMVSCLNALDVIRHKTSFTAVVPLPLPAPGLSPHLWHYSTLASLQPQPWTPYGTSHIPSAIIIGEAPSDTTKLLSTQQVTTIVGT